MLLPSAFFEERERDRRESVGIHADGTLTLNERTTKALVELFRFRQRELSKDQRIDELYEAFFDQTGIDIETYT